MKHLYLILGLAAAGLPLQSHADDWAGSGTAEDPYQIASVADMQTLLVNVNSSGGDTYEGRYFIVTNDLTWTDYSGIGIGMSNRSFCGTFDGQGYTWHGINATLNKNASGFGVFSYIGTTGTVRNVNIDGISISALGNANYNGTLCSYNGGLIDNCHITNATLDYSLCSTANQNGGLVAYLYESGKIANSSFSGNVKAKSRFGAVAGINNYGQVEGCVSNADITITGTPTYIGGFTGTAYGRGEGGATNYSNCIFRGTIKVQSASVSGPEIGGIAGEGQGANFSKCVNEGSIVGLGYAGGVLGRAFKGCTLYDCYNAGTVEDIFMAHDSTTVTYNMSSYMAGVVGYVYEGSVERCWNVGKVRGYRYAGGIVGLVDNCHLKDCYNVGLIDAPYVWVTGSTTKEGGGGIVGTKSATFEITMENCLSLGTVNNSSAVRYADSEYIGDCTVPDKLTISNCYYDSQTAGYGSNKGSLTTAQLTSGEPLDGFSTDVWLFTPGLYPRLKATSDTDAALVGATPYFLPEGSTHGKVLADVTLGEQADVAWSCSASDNATIEGNTLKVKRGSLPETIVLTATKAGYSRSAYIDIYPDMFAGVGTAADPYVIATYDDMKKLSTATAAGMDFFGEYLTLSADIDMQGDSEFGCFSLAAEAPFAGSFDGNGHTLSNWVLANHTNLVGYGGLFGYISASGVVKNLTIDKTCNVGLYTNGGTIVGSLRGTVENCRVLPAAISSASASGTFGGIAGYVYDSGVVSDCYVASDINLNGAANTVGGIAATSYGSIEGCQYAGSLTGSAASLLGGIVAQNDGTIDNCLSSGVVTANATVGGIVGNNLSSGIIKNSLTTAIVGFSSDVDNAGAVTGKNAGTLENVVYDSQISIYDNIGAKGSTGMLTRQIISEWRGGEKWINNGTTYPQLAKFAAENNAMLTSYPIIFADTEKRTEMSQGVSATLYVADGLTWKLEDADDFTIRSGELSFDGYTSFCYDEVKQSYGGATRVIPISAYGSILSGSGSADDPWIIATEANLRKLSTETARAANHNDYAGKHFLFTADIVLDDTPFTSIASGNSKKFNGIIHGAGHSISNLNISGTTVNTGLVGYLGDKGRIENLTIESGAISSTQTHVGGFVGYCNGGAIVGCTNKASVTGSGKYYAAGIVGCAVSPTELNDLTNYGDISNAAFYTAGIVGYISGSTTYGQMTNYGSVTGTMHCGGVVGCVVGAPLDYLTNYGDIYGAAATTNMQGGVIGTVDACPSIGHARNFGSLTLGATGIGGIIGRYWPSTNTDNALVVSDCYNAGKVEAKTKNIGGIVGMADSYNLTVIRCANVDSVINTAATVKAADPGAGGIVGGGSPTIIDCLNAGVVMANNCVGGILGRPTANASAVQITRCLNVGWVEGYGESSANVGAIAGYNSSQAVYSDNAYDKQMCNVPAVGLADVEGTSPMATADIAVASPSFATGDGAAAWTAALGRYPTLTAWSDDDALLACSLPVMLTSNDTRYEVTTDFSVATDRRAIWTYDEPLSINDGGFVTVDKLPEDNLVTLQGDYTLTVTVGDFSRHIPLSFNYSRITSGIDDIANAQGKALGVAGGIILPAGPYRIVNIAGLVMAGGTATDGATINLPAGVYVVESAGNTSKVIVQ